LTSHRDTTQPEQLIEISAGDRNTQLVSWSAMARVGHTQNFNEHVDIPYPGWGNIDRQPWIKKFMDWKRKAEDWLDAKRTSLGLALWTTDTPRDYTINGYHA